LGATRGCLIPLTLANLLEAELAVSYVVSRSRGRIAVMPISKELTIRLEDRPGTLGKCCRSLAQGAVNILAFQAYEREGQSLIRMVVDDPARAKELLDADRIYYTEAEVAQITIPHHPGELARVASQLGEAYININYAYCGTDPASQMPLVIFGVTDVARAVRLLDRLPKENVIKTA